MFFKSSHIWELLFIHIREDIHIILKYIHIFLKMENRTKKNKQTKPTKKKKQPAGG